MERQENLDEIYIETAEDVDTVAEAAEVPEQSEENAEQPEESTEQLEENPELREALDKYLRLAAEYDNFRKRTAKERETLVSESRNYAVTQLLPILDNLERAATQACADEAYAQGIVMIVRQWHETLGKMGITAIGALNQVFDPNLHNAVMHGEDDTLPASTITEEFQKGYLSGDRVIRPSMVKVVN
ncbi:MAG: nucleotide exchange factor GrpE [Oscillospiraceae bacterium]|nr:nucleotide exchange factor GrpE [Oscillospiraceae bacterium]